MNNESAEGNKIIIAGAAAAFLVCVIIVLGIFFKPKLPLWNFSASPEEAEKAYAYTPRSDSTIIKFTEGVNAWYVNEKLGFSFRLPDGFSAPDGKVAGADTHVVELSNGKGNDLHVVALKIKEGADQVLTEKAIRANAPEEVLSGFTSGMLPDGTAGYVFETNAEKWAGEGLAFWFTKDGYLFTLSTAKKDEELLDLVMKTWNFGRPVAPPIPAR